MYLPAMLQNLMISDSTFTLCSSNIMMSQIRERKQFFSTRLVCANYPGRFNLLGFSRLR